MASYTETITISRSVSQNNVASATTTVATATIWQYLKSNEDV